MKTAEETERIVLEVIRRLTNAKPNVTTKGGTLLLDDRVITLATLENRLAGVRQIVVHPQAVVTPSVQDELRTHNVQLVRQRQPTGHQTGLRLYVANSGNIQIADLLGDLSCDATTLGQGPLESTISNMTSLLINNALGVIFTDVPEAAACLANRDKKVNAFVGWNHESVRRATSTMSANLLVLETSSSLAAKKDMLQQFVLAGGSTR